MSTVSRLEKEVMTLNKEECAALAFFILDHIDDSHDIDQEQVERAWYDEAERRVSAPPGVLDLDSL